MRWPWSSKPKASHLLSESYCHESPLRANRYRLGCHVIATARNTDVLKGMDELGMSCLRLDVTDAKSIATCKEQVAELTGGRLDVLVNNA